LSQHQIGKSYAWLVWSLAAISFGYAFFHRVTPSVMVADLMADFAVSGAFLGTLSARRSAAGCLTTSASASRSLSRALSSSASCWPS